MQADLNIARNGEVVSPLQKLVNEIDILMSIGRNMLITNLNASGDLEEYLFKSGISAETVATNIRTNIEANVSPGHGASISVDASFFNGKGVRDILFVNIILETKATKAERQYVIQ